MLGLFTKPTAFILSGMMPVGYFMSHFPRDFYPTLNGGDATILYASFFFTLVLLAAAHGPWMHSKREATTLRIDEVRESSALRLRAAGPLPVKT
jgi:putative oxidoreductase